jgi:hypothetical protein
VSNQRESGYDETATEYGRTEPGYHRTEPGYHRTEPGYHRTEPGYREAGPPPKRPVWHYAVLGLLGLIAIGGIISAIVTTGGRSTPPPTAPTAAAAPVGSTFLTRDAAGTTYRVRLARFIDPARGVGATPASGSRLVGAVYTVAGVSGSPAGENVVTSASLLSSSGHIYRATGGRIAGYSNFSNSNIIVPKGGSVTGAAAYQVPSGVRITQAQWAAAAGRGEIIRWAVP